MKLYPVTTFARDIFPKFLVELEEIVTLDI